MQWQQDWQAQARVVSEAQDMLRHGQVDTHTRERLEGAEQAAGQLEAKMHEGLPPPQAGS